MDMPERDFDAAAATWDEEPRRQKLAADVAAAITEILPLSDQWDAIDFGCGTGLVTLLLAPHLQTIVGVDASRGMLEQLEAKVASAGLENVRTLTADLLEQEPPARYDLITSTMTLHHIKDIPALLTMLHIRLRTGGYIALADLETEDGSFHPDPAGVFHHGFSSQELADLLRCAGFASISVRRITEVIKGGRSYRIVLATATACR